MKTILLFLTTCLMVVTVEAQKVYFVYFQSDNGVPFYVKLNGKIFNSTSSGYLILPNLVENNYQFTVGSPGGSLPDTRFSVDVNNSDKGFLLKKFDDGLGLFDLQTLAIHRASTNESTVSKPGAKKDDPFSKLLSKAADDSTILNTPVRTPEVVKQQVPQPEKTDVVKQETPQPEKTEPVAVIEEKKEPIQEKSSEIKQDKTVENKTESKAALPQETKQEPVTSTTTEPAPVIQKSEPVKNEDVSSIKRTETAPIQNNQTYESYKRSIVTRRAESSTTEGFGLIFLDNINGNIDTVRILIPNSTSSIRITGSSQESAKQISNNTSSERVTPVTSTPPPVVNSSKTNCSSLASEEIFRKLRRNMAGENNDQDMIEEARKAFRTKCFTTEQIRHLSALFLSAESKYRFFDTAYRHVSDIENFPSLQSEIKDEYYGKRFNALIAE